MISYKEFINEKKVLIYHGDNFNSKKLDPKLMNNGNNQEGIGIYFGDLKTAEVYGKYIMSLEIDTKKYIDSRGFVGDLLNQRKLIKLLKILHKIDEEAMYYLLTDWIEIFDTSDITDEHIEYYAEKLKDEEIRNLQITLAKSFGVVDFVETWVKVFTNIDGTVNKELNFYAVINYKLKPALLS